MVFPGSCYLSDWKKGFNYLSPHDTGESISLYVHCRLDHLSLKEQSADHSQPSWRTLVTSFLRLLTILPSDLLYRILKLPVVASNVAVKDTLKSIRRRGLSTPLRDVQYQTLQRVPNRAVCGCSARGYQTARPRPVIIDMKGAER
jgi:hypothetical protein